jgi:hypothetical protein|tara:strand:- start:910 stop:1281 length:372 start_codon:yes stop_codon:yes gene_type:complete
MSFFVSDSLKSIISEEDLVATSPIKITEVSENLTIHVLTDQDKNFELEIIEINFHSLRDEFIVMTSKEYLSEIFNAHNLRIDYSIMLNKKQFMQDKGTFNLVKLEINNEDNYVTCQIVINKQR